MPAPFRLSLPLLFGLLLTVSCKEESIAPPAEIEGKEYFPLSLDRSWYYAVDSIRIRPVLSGTDYDTSRLEVRETLVDTFRDATGQLWYRGERWQRDRPATRPWRFDQTYAVAVDRSTARRTEDNLTFTKLTFPPRNGRSWDGHAAFDEFRILPIGGEFLDVYAGWNYRYDRVAEPLDLDNGLAFERGLTVDQAQVDNLIDFRQAYERYAAGVGLVERFVDARHTQCRSCCGGDTDACLDLSWNVKAEKGFILRQILIKIE